MYDSSLFSILIERYVIVKMDIIDSIATG